MSRAWWPIIVALSIPIPWIVMGALHFEMTAGTTAFLTGTAIVGAAFLLSWASEASEMDLPKQLALVVLAVVAVLPEYFVSWVLAWKAGKDLSYAAYVTANMTGANRILIGLAWPMVVFTFWFRTRHTEVRIPEAQRIDLAILMLGTFYAFFIVLRSFIWGEFLGWYDFIILVLLFGFYVYKIWGIPETHVLSVGPARLIAELPKKGRVSLWLFFMAYAAFTVIISAEPFVHGLLEIGKSLRINEFMLLQWIAPLASETPEFVVALLFVLNRRPEKGLGVLVSSKVNQWTLLIATIPFLFFISRGAVTPFPLDPLQIQEIALTAAQSIFAVTVLANLSLSIGEATLLASLYLVQFFIPIPGVRIVVTILYLGATLAAIVFTRGSSWKGMARSLLK